MPRISPVRERKIHSSYFVKDRLQQVEFLEEKIPARGRGQVAPAEYRQFRGLWRRVGRPAQRGRHARRRRAGQAIA